MPDEEATCSFQQDDTAERRGREEGCERSRACDACHERREKERAEQQRHNMTFVPKMQPRATLLIARRACGDVTAFTPDPKHGGLNKERSCSVDQHAVFDKYHAIAL